MHDPEVYNKQKRMLRIRYLKNGCTQEDFRIKMQRICKAEAKHLEIAQVNDMYGNAARAIVSSEVQKAHDAGATLETKVVAANAIIEQVVALAKHTSATLWDIDRWYGSKSKLSSNRYTITITNYINYNIHRSSEDGVRKEFGYPWRKKS